MVKSIYKIENLINHKVYIGQTTDIKRRFREHRNQKRENHHKILYDAFNKYGIENFEFSIIEENIENYNEREKYWIEYYDSFYNGYNMTPGGEEPPVFHGEEHHLATHTQEDVNYVIKLLKETTLSTREIAEKTSYDETTINRINTGILWFNENIQYPIRKLQSHQGKRERANKIKFDLLNTNITQKEIAKKYGVARTTVTAINNGQNFYDNTLTYPLRK